MPTVRTLAAPARRLFAIAAAALTASVLPRRAQGPNGVAPAVGPQVVVESGALAMRLATTPGLGLIELRSRSVREGGGVLIRHGEPARFFAIAYTPPGGRETYLDSLAFRAAQVTAHDDGAIAVDLVPLDEGTALRIRLLAQPTARNAVRWTATLEAAAGGRADLVFPILEEIRPGTRMEDVGYFFPRDPGLKNNIPISLRTNYGQYATSQLISVFNDRWGEGGGGIACIWADTTLRRKSFELVKAAPDGPDPVELHDTYGFPFWKGLQVTDGVGFASKQPNIVLTPGEAFTTPPVLLSVYRGPWQCSLQAYRRWAESWYASSAPEALRRFFTFESYHGYAKCRFWFPDSVDEAIAGIPRGIDQLHFIVNNVDRYGDLAYRDDWGLPGLKQFMAAARSRGKLCSHYVQGLLVNKETEAYASLERLNGQKKADGSNAVAFGNQCMCCASKGWHQWLADTSVRLVRDLDFDVIYLDTCGWTTGEKFVCANENHFHLPEYHRLSHMRDLLHAAKTAIRGVRADVGLTTEGPVIDLFFNDVDGNEGYGVRFFHDPAYGPPIHFMRFLYPRFKYLDLGTDSPRDIAEVLFNGTATSARPDGDPLAARAHSIFHENVDAYLSDQAYPDLPVREPGVFCNRFPAEGKTLHTVYNDNPYRTSGALVPLDVPAGSHIVELVRQRQARTVRVDYAPHAVVDLPSHETAVLAVLPEVLSLELGGMFLSAHCSAPGSVQALLLDDADLPGAAVPLPRDSPVDLVKLTGRGRFRVVVRLLEEGLLRDHAEVPLLADIDIAAAADAAAGNEHVPHGSDPQSVVGRDGSWKFAWNDEPRPGWIRLKWRRPQTFNRIAMTFGRTQYAPRDCEVQGAAEAGNWQTLFRGGVTGAEEIAFEPVTVSSVRILFHQGGTWANLVSLRRLKVLYAKATGPADSTLDDQLIRDAQRAPVK